MTIKEQLEMAIDEIFLREQKKRNIMSGDVSPEMEFELNHDVCVLATMINLILEEQENATRIEDDE